MILYQLENVGKYAKQMSPTCLYIIKIGTSFHYMNFYSETLICATYA